MMRGSSAFMRGAHEGFYGVEGALEVGVEHGVPVFFLHAHEQGVAGDAGVVDEDVHGAEFRGDCFREVLHGGVVGDIDGVGGRAAGEVGVDRVRGGAAASGTAGNDGDLGAFRGKAAGDVLADSTASSGDDGDFIGET